MTARVLTGVVVAAAVTWVYVDVVFASKGAQLSPVSTPPSPPATATQPSAPPSSSAPGSSTGGAGATPTRSVTTSPPSGGVPRAWPGPDDTGVPAGTALSTYTGPCDIRGDSVVIDSKIVNCGGMLNYSPNLVIRNSRVNSTIMNNSDAATLTLEASEVNGGAAYQGVIEGSNVTIRRSDIYGGEHGVHCGSDCDVRDSWIHDQHQDRSWHQNGFLSNGGTNFTLIHNTIACVGGCTADIAFLNDGDLSNATVSRNLLVAAPDAAYCSYPAGGTSSKPGTSSNMRWTDNVFERGANRKCATYGPVYAFPAGNGNVWSGNTWSDGTAVQP